MAATIRITVKSGLTYEMTVAEWKEIYDQLTPTLGTTTFTPANNYTVFVERPTGPQIAEMAARDEQPAGEDK